MAPAPRPVPRLVRRWEALEGGQQAMIAYPILVVLLFFAHLAFPGLRHKPLLAALYGLLWALPATAAIVSATAYERRKRRGTGGPKDGDGDDV